MIRYLIVDDEPPAHELIKRFAEELPQLQLAHQCYNALDALAYLADHTVDLIFLDLNMPKLKGFAFLRTLPQPPAVIVTTAYQEFALEGFELNVVDYLLKPYSMERFLQAVQRAQLRLQPAPTPKVASQDNHLFVKSDKAYHQIDLTQLALVAAYGNYTKLYLDDRMLLNHDNISSVEKLLPETAFMRVHKSYIVSLRKIEKVEGNQIVIGAHKVPIGQTYRPLVASIVKRKE